MKKLIFCILALLLLTTAAFAVPGDSCVVLGEELTLGETDGIFTALGVERGKDLVSQQVKTLRELHGHSNQPGGPVPVAHR